ncbi:MAG TPA: hypothetical protein VHC43_14940 [Mycobacteriales bacterium]|nr:hypothetical protein [Mycobacteriales bacterium]
MNGRAATFVALVTLVVVTIAAAVSLGGASAHAAGTPPWEPDPNAVARIAFFDSSGHRITSGSTHGAMAAYDVADATIVAGDNAALLYAAVPDTDEDPADWTRELLSGPSPFPAPGAPASFGSDPTVAGAAQDESLARFASDFPSPTGLYQIRIVTENSGGSGVQSAAYAAADILIRGRTWTEVYPKDATGRAVLRNSARPRLSGKHEVGRTERCSNGSWSPKPSAFTYQWFKGRSKIKRATKSHLLLTKALKGKRVHCTVTAHRPGLKNVAASSRSAKVR